MIIELMTRTPNPINCDLCSKVIDGQQYVMECFQGKSTFTSPRTRAKKIIDCCHPCFLKVCENGYKPDWIDEIRNPSHVAGAKRGSGKEYWIEANQGRTAPREEPKQEVLVGAV